MLYEAMFAWKYLWNRFFTLYLVCQAVMLYLLKNIRSLFLQLHQAQQNPHVRRSLHRRFFYDATAASHLFRDALIQSLFTKECLLCKEQTAFTMPKFLSQSNLSAWAFFNMGVKGDNLTKQTFKSKHSFILDCPVRLAAPLLYSSTLRCHLSRISQPKFPKLVC